MLQEGRFTLISEQEREPGLFEAEFLERLRIVTSYSPVSDDYYDDPGLNAILRTYRQRLAGTSFLLPIGAIRSIRNLLALSSGNLLLLAADKGYTDESQLRDRDPSLDVQGSLSMQGMAVNLHAIQRYFQGLGGEALHTSGWNTTLVVSAFLARDPPLDHPETRAAFLEDVARLSPYHYYLLASGIRKERDAPSLERILAVLRLSHWDPQLILWFAPAMREQVKLAPRQIKREVEQAMERVWDHYYSMGEKEDLAFEIATILQKMNRPGEALRYYQRSRLLSGEHQATAFNMALCHHELEQLEEAIRYMSLALELDATYRPAREWQAHLQAQLENKRAG
jgi:tetratricopeptide (TPR) repeat protein